MTADASRVRALFDDAADLPAEEREAFVLRACAGDDALAEEVRRLLAYVDAPTPVVDVAAVEVPVPARLGRFELRGKLGEGGMGVVYRALDHALEREVALKLVHAGGADAQARLLREAQAMARVAHPNVVPIFDVGVERDQVYLAMELVHGTTLTAWLRAGPRDWRATLRLLVDAGRGLAAAHRAGLLHRDVKPDNILVGDDGRARMGDFGLARAERDGHAGEGMRAGDAATGARAGVAAELTHAGAIVGTPGFMAPEQLDGDVSVFSDQWSFAATAYYALFGVLPWSAPDLRGLRDAVRSTPPRPPPRGDVPSVVCDALVRGLARLRQEARPRRRDRRRGARRRRRSRRPRPPAGSRPPVGPRRRARPGCAPTATRRRPRAISPSPAAAGTASPARPRAARRAPPGRRPARS